MSSTFLGRTLRPGASVRSRSNLRLASIRSQNILNGADLFRTPASILPRWFCVVILRQRATGRTIATGQLHPKKYCRIPGERLAPKRTDPVICGRFLWSSYLWVDDGTTKSNFVEDRILVIKSERGSVEAQKSWRPYPKRAKASRRGSWRGSLQRS